MKILTTLIISFFFIFHSNSFSATKEPLTVMQEIKALGVFAEPKVYPAGMLESFSKSCVKFYCRANKATKIDWNIIIEKYKQILNLKINLTF